MENMPEDMILESYGGVISNYSPTKGFPIIILNNLKNDKNVSSPNWLNNVEFQFHREFSEITINGATAFARNQFMVTTETTFTIEYKYGDGKYYRFVTIADPTAYTMSGFTIEEFVR